MPKFNQSKLQSDQQRNPYPSVGLFGKIKSFFSKPESPTRKTRLAEPTKNDHIPDTSNLSLSKNPNDTLATFFNSKGDNPLNEVEIEGVMSLIRRAQDHSIDTSRSALISSSRANISRENSLLFNDSTILREAGHSGLKVPMFNPRNRSGSSVSSSKLKLKFDPIVRKRKLIDYTAVKGQDTVSSPLGAFIEKRKREREEKQKQQEKLLKDKFVVNGTVIDVEKFDNKEQAKDSVKRQKMSKTANTLLDILDFKKEDEDEGEGEGKVAGECEDKKQLNEVAPSKIEEKKNVKVKRPTPLPSIFTNNESTQNSMTDKEIIKIGNNGITEASIGENADESNILNKQAIKVPTLFSSKKPITDTTAAAAPATTTTTTSAIITTEKTAATKELEKPVTAVFSKPINESFVSNGKDLDSDKVSEKPKFEFKPKPFLNGGTLNSASTTKIKPVFEFKTQTAIQNSTEDKKENVAENDEENEEREIIDSFDFPDVSDTNIEVKNFLPFKNSQKSVKEKASDSTAEETFIFPNVDAAPKEILEKIDQAQVELYNDTFVF